MTREYFEETDFYNVMEKIKQETDNIITLEELQQLAIEALENGDWTYAKHLIDALYNGCDEDYWLYDRDMGYLDTPIPVDEKEDVEHLIEE